MAELAQEAPGQHHWELIKENARPLRSGYAPATLTELASSPQERSRLEDEQR